jgi:hypothetical protein
MLPFLLLSEVFFGKYRGNKKISLIKNIKFSKLKIIRSNNDDKNY